MNLKRLTHFRHLLSLLIVFSVLGGAVARAAPHVHASLSPSDGRTLSTAWGFPTIYDNTIPDAVLVSRPGYHIFIPSTTQPGDWREMYLFGALDDYNQRVDRYRHAFVIAMLQPELTARLRNDVYLTTSLRDLAEDTSQVTGIGSDLLELASILKSGQGLFELEPSSIEATLNDWDSVADNAHLSESLDLLGDALGLISLSFQIHHDVLDDMFLHAITNGRVLERKAYFEEFFASYVPPAHLAPLDPAMLEGFTLACQDVDKFLQEDVSVLESTINSFEEHSGEYSIELLPYLTEVALQFVNVGASATIQRVLFPYYLSYEILKSYSTEIIDMQIMCAAATIDRHLFAWEQDLETTLPSPDDPSYDEHRRRILTVVEMRYGLGYHYNSKYDEILRMDDLLAWVVGIIEWIGGSSSAAQYRAEVLQPWMDANYDHAVETLPYLDFMTSELKPTLAGASLSPGSTGTPETAFVFRITYTHPGNQPPTYVQVHINGTPLQMAPVNPSDTDYTDGALYRYTATFPPGHYLYYYTASDGLFTIEGGSTSNFRFTVAAPSASGILVNVAPSSIPMDGFSRSTITAQVTDDGGTPMQGQTVQFLADKSFSFNPGYATTDQYGIATSQFRPNDLGDYTVTAVSGAASGSATVHVYPVDDAYSIQLSAFVEDPDQALYQIQPYVTYTASGQPVYAKTLHLSTNRGTFQNGQQTISILLTAGKTDPLDPYNPVRLTVGSSGSVQIVGTVDTSSASLVFDVIIGEPPEVAPAYTVAGYGLYESDHELAWSPDGRFLATIENNGLSVWNILNWRKVANLTYDGNRPRTVEWSPLGTYIATAEKNGTVNIWRVSDFGLHLHKELSDSINNSISWSDDESYVAIISGDNEITILNASTGSVARTLTVDSNAPFDPHESEELYGLEWDGDRLAAGGETGIAYVWNTSTWVPILSHNLEFRSIESVAWSHDGGYAAFVGRGYTGSDHDIAFFRRSDNSITHCPIDVGTVNIDSVDWAPDQNLLVINNDDAEVVILDMSCSVKMQLINGGMYSVAWSPADLIAVARDTVQIYAPYDVSYPGITIDSPQEGATTPSGSVQVRGNVWDESGIKSATVIVNGGSPQSITVEDDGSFSTDVSLSDGMNELVVSVSDIVDHSTQVTLHVEKLYDHYGPLISDQGASATSGALGTVFILTAVVEDSWSGVDGTSVRAHIQLPDENSVAILNMQNDVQDASYASGGIVFSAQWDSAGFPEGVYQVDFTASDAEGNVSELENALTISIHDSPQIDSISHLPSQPTTSNAVIITAAVTDSSGVAVTTIHYSTNDGTTWIPVGMTYSAAQSRYVGIIPQQPPGQVLYRVEASDPFNYTSISSVLEYEVVLDPLVYKHSVHLPLVLSGHTPVSQLWQIGTFNNSSSEFDSYPNDDPEVAVFTVGQPASEFPNGLGTDIGNQRSVIEIHFNADLSTGSTLWIRWSPGGSSSVEQFSVSLDGAVIGQSQALAGQGSPYIYVAESFSIPPTAGNSHCLRLEQLSLDGDGNHWDALRLGGNAP